MIKLIKKSFVFVSFIGFVLLFAGCNNQTPDPEHIHTFSTEWEYNETEHWHPATCEHYEQKKDVEAHTFGEYKSNNDATEQADGTKSRTCKICGYVQTVTDEGTRLIHTHTFSDAWSKDVTGHWHAATCNHVEQKKDFAAHTYGAWASNEDATTEKDGTKTHVCTVCGYAETVTDEGSKIVNNPEGGNNNTPAGEDPNGGNNNTPAGEDANSGNNNPPSGDNNNTPPAGEDPNSGNNNPPAGEDPNSGNNNPPSGDNNNNPPAGEDPNSGNNNPPAHVHTFATECTKDSTGHWYAATCEHTSEKSCFAEHTFGNWHYNNDATELSDGTKTGSCTICGYQTTVPAEGTKLQHTHTYSSEWTKDSTGHWHAATCEHTSEIKDFAAHTWGNWSYNNDATYEHDGTKTHSCKICQYEETVTDEGTMLLADTQAPDEVQRVSVSVISETSVKIKWFGPYESDRAKVKIYYGDGLCAEQTELIGRIGESEFNTYVVEGLTSGYEYKFTLKSVDTTGNESNGVSVISMPGPLTNPNKGTNGGLEGTTAQTQGQVVISDKTDDSGNLKVNGTVIDKTSEVVVVPDGTYAYLDIMRNTKKNILRTISYENYLSEYDTKTATERCYYTGFINSYMRLSPFVMSQYEVTQKLYNEVMGELPEGLSATGDNKPVENVDWYLACAFCNELTKAVDGSEQECVYYRDEYYTEIYTKADAATKSHVYPLFIKENNGECYWAKKGYRLPTGSEWEFAARGGNPNAAEWRYAFAGSQTAKIISTNQNQTKESTFVSNENADTGLNDYGWYYHNSQDSNGNAVTHDVGTKLPNKLKLYDMCGNVSEWSYDSTNSFDPNCKLDNYYINPFNDYLRVTNLVEVGDPRFLLGGDAGINTSIIFDARHNRPSTCAVSTKYEMQITPANGSSSNISERHVGFRVCRSYNDCNK